MHPDGYTDDEVRAELEDFPEAAPDDYVGPLAENDGDFLNWPPDYDDPDALSAAALTRRLPPAPRAPERRSLESFDRERVTCVHELARALEEFSTKEPVPLFGTQAEFDEAAIAIVELMGAQRCPLKGR